MHKNRLQELSHKRMWSLPAYTASRDGPDHSPLFGASVFVNGQTFEAPNLCKSLKEAQNKAAEVALDQLSAILSASPAPAPPSGDAPPPATKAQNSYKSQLQHYVQKRSIDVPKYISVFEGSAHALRFKARVTVDGQTFESSQHFNTLREAEHSAAKVALMSLPLEENHQDEPKFYKNLLQQLAQKEGLSLPIYETLCDGESHMPIFTSTVVLDGERFAGDAARTKKQAEMNAAQVALNHVKGRINPHSVKLACGKPIESLPHPKIYAVQPSSVKTEERNQTAEGNDACLSKIIQPATGISLKYQVKLDSSSLSLRNQLVGIDAMDQSYLNSILTPKIKEDHRAKANTNTLEKQNGLSVPISNVRIKEQKQANGKIEYHERVVANKTYRKVSVDAYTDKLVISNLTPDSNGSSAKNRSPVVNNSLNSKNSSGLIDQLNFSALKLDFDGNTKQEDSKDVSSEDIGAGAIKDNDADVRKIVDSPSLLCDRVLVYPRKPDVVLPAGATLLPFSDGAWVAVSLDFSEHEDN